VTINLLSSIDLGGAEISSYAKEHAVALVITGDNNLVLVNYKDPANPSVITSLILDGQAQSALMSPYALLPLLLRTQTTPKLRTVILSSID
jgi:hypothetical protein